ASFSSEVLQRAEASQVTPVMRAETSSRLSPELIVEKPGDEPGFQIMQPGNCVSETGTTAEAREDIDKQPQEPQPEYAKEREVAAKYQNDRETLLSRALSTENDLHRAEAQIKRRNETIEDLHRQLSKSNTS